MVVKFFSKYSTLIEVFNTFWFEILKHVNYSDFAGKVQGFSIAEG